MGVKARKKEPNSVWIVLKKLFFENLKNHQGNTICQKNCFIFEISFYIFKATTIKFS